MKGEGYVTMGTAKGLAADSAQKNLMKAPSVQKQYGLIPCVQIFLKAF
jgi:hypothetical protein